MLRHTIARRPVERRRLSSMHERWRLSALAQMTPRAEPCARRQAAVAVGWLWLEPWLSVPRRIPDRGADSAETFTVLFR
jgi:hypothetical protein